MTQKKIDRINAQAKKAKSPEGLTPEEEAERAVLRREYIDAYKRSLIAQLDNTYIQYPDGKRRKLEKESIFFEGSYPDLSDEQICEIYDRKYEGITLSFPKQEEARLAMVEKFRRGLLTTYSPEKTEEIIKEALERGYITEIQRRFGIHYHAVDNYNMGGHILEMMHKQDLYPSKILREGKIEL